MRIAIAAALRARAKAEAEAEEGTLGSLDRTTEDFGPFRSGGRRWDGARGIGDLGLRGWATGGGYADPRSRRYGSSSRGWVAGEVRPRRRRPPRSTSEAAGLLGRKGERRGMQAWKPGGEGTTRLFYVVAAEEFVEAARIFGDFFFFFTGWRVAQLGWNECGGQRVGG
jgi:hypothetical protein